MRVIVIGGGIAGLAAAWLMANQGAGVTLMEAGPVPGGQIRSRRIDGFLVEEGAEGFPARRTATAALCERLGLNVSLLPQRCHRSFVWRGDGLEELERGTAATRLGLAVDGADLGAGLVTLRDGMGQLVEALARSLEGAGTVKLSCRVNGLTRVFGAWKVWCADGITDADAVILAVPAPEMAALLEPALGRLPLLMELPATDSITVSLAAPRAALAPPAEASGFIADHEGRFRGCSFCSAKFDHRAPAGWHLLRVFFRPEPDAGELTDREWIDRAEAVLRPAVGLTERPSRAWVSRWPRALPQYPEGFSDQAAALQRRVQNLGNVTLAGSAVAPGGIDGAVRSAQAAVEALAVSR